MGSFQTFSELSELNKERAIARFLNAGPYDGFLYEIDRNGQVISRKKAITSMRVRLR